MSLIDRVKGDYRKPEPAPRRPLQALPLRTYQREALEALAEQFAQGELRRLAVVLPTGAGKTVCFAHQCMRFLDEHPDQRVVILVHTDELVAQAYRKVLDVAPHLKVGIVKAAKNEVAADVIVASVQSLRNPKRRKEIRHVGMVIVDECHHATAATYMAILTDFGCFGGGAIAVGYTATLVRGDSKSLYPVWQDVAFRRDISWMVRKRYLIPPRGKAIEVPDLDLRKVKSTRADYREGELGEALAESLAPELVAKAVLEHAPDRKVLAFFPTVTSAYVFASAFEDQGIEARVVHGGLSAEERRNVLAWHRRGTVLVNCMVLTEGYDDPEVDCIVMGRPTKNTGLYQQIVGRGLRVDPDRPYEDQDCLILDVVGASAGNDLRSLVDLSERKLSEKDAHSGKTLVELEDELDAGPGVGLDEPVWYTGDVVARDFDPLGQPTTRVWLKTKGGTFFLPAGKLGYVFIMQWPAAGQWSVAWCGKDNGTRYVVDGEGVPRPGNGGRPVGMTAHRGLPLDQALVWAGDLAVDMGADLNTTHKSAPWRKRVASEKMVSLARALGLKVEGETNGAGMFVATEKAGVLSDRITEVMGTRRIDPIVKAVRERKG